MPLETKKFLYDVQQAADLLAQFTEGKRFEGHGEPSWFHWLLSVASCVVVLTGGFLATSCGHVSNDKDVDKRFYGYFLRDAKAMQEKGLPVYWLGRGFTSQALTFQGPHGLEFGGDVQGGGIFMRYTAWLDGTPGEGRNTGLEMTVYGPDAWSLARERTLNPRRLTNDGEPTRRAVAVQGRDAELVSIPRFSRNVDQVRLIVDLNSVVVVAVARSDGTQYSIFTKNPDLLVQAIDENLRPYPN